MTTTKKSTLKTEVHFSEDSKHRYLLRKEWDKRKKKAMVIMKNPSDADDMILDVTTLCVINNLTRLDFGSVDIVNMFSRVDTKLSLKQSDEELIGKENDEYIKKSASDSDCIIIAWGSVGKNGGKIKVRQQEILKILDEHKDKMYEIGDSTGKKGFHPLAPQVRHSWELKELYEKTEENSEEDK
ncbi:MAG: DUF1643 domain-containing protein [Firmicutes bacterium]|nr:DUF1643 domain-containing protein [Bacillota bacterium]